MNKLGYMFILVLPFMVSCKRSNTSQNIMVKDSLFQTITVDPDDISKQEMSLISDIADEVEYIPLQTEDSTLIGEIKKIIVWNNDYYIWDGLSESVFCFDSDGKYQYKISKRGEAPDQYFCIRDFTIDRQTGNIIIYSDRNQGFYEYTSEMIFVNKTEVPFVLLSFAAKGNWKYCYLGGMPNMDFYKKEFPESYRYVTLSGERPQNRQLKYKYDECYLRVPLSSNNFTFYGDTILMTEYLNPEVYWIDSLGNLNPRYCIKFITNGYTPTFNETIDLERMEQEKKQGKLTSLFNDFYETKKYIFFTYDRGLVGMAYVDKRDDSVHNIGYFLTDDFNQNSLPTTIGFVDEKYIYQSVEADRLIMKSKKMDFSPYLKNICKNIQEFDNPVIIKIKLK